jgi:hypothetical protein
MTLSRRQAWAVEQAMAVAARGEFSFGNEMMAYTNYCIACDKRLTPATTCRHMASTHADSLLRYLEDAPELPPAVPYSLCPECTFSARRAEGGGDPGHCHSTECRNIGYALSSSGEHAPMFLHRYFDLLCNDSQTRAGALCLARHRDALCQGRA